MDKKPSSGLPTLSYGGTILFHEGDILLFNTLNDEYSLSDFIGKYHIYILCFGGNAQFSLNGRIFTIVKNDFTALPIDLEISNLSHSSDFDSDILLVSKNFLYENNPMTTWTTKGYLFVKENPVFHLEASYMKMLSADFIRFREQLALDSHIFLREVLGRQMQIFLFDLWNIYSNEINRHAHLNHLSAGLFSRFLDLVRQRISEKRDVGFYAGLLCVTPKYLSEVVRKTSGKPASYWINSYAIQEIISLLKRRELTISEISDRMNFYSQSHFSRFVKNVLGVSPTEYRRNIDKKNE